MFTDHISIRHYTARATGSLGGRNVPREEMNQRDDWIYCNRMFRADASGRAV